MFVFVSKMIIGDSAKSYIRNIEASFFLYFTNSRLLERFAKL